MTKTHSNIEKGWISEMFTTVDCCNIPNLEIILSY